MFNGHNRLREFGRLRLDVENKFLWHAGEPVDLPLKGLELLCLLVENEGSVVSKPDIWENVWRDAFVEETNLTHHIYLLRRKFKELGEPDPIETVPRRGYRFRTRTEASTDIIIERRSITETVIEQIDARRPEERFRSFALAGSVVIAIVSVAFAGYVLLEKTNSASARTVFAAETSSPRDAARAEYEKGRIEWNKRSYAGMLEAQRLFRNALAIDRDFAPAYAGLADTLATGADRDESSRLLERALEIDPDLAEAHASKGFIAMFHARDWKLAESSLKRATELDVGYATAHHWLGVLMSIRGRNDAAKAAMLKAIELDSESPNFLADMGQLHYFSRDYRTAEAFCQKALQMDPEFIFAWEYLHDIYLMTGEYDKAIDAELTAQRLNGTLPNDPAELKDRSAADRARQRNLFLKGGIEMFERDRAERSEGILAATRLAFLGDRDGALEKLERSVMNGEFLAVFAEADPIFDSVRGDPRFKAALARMRLD
jgi:DNA-binding winged helix-turn-helix (wHTH) protein/Tfp pilus assembly protein PilF